MKDNCFYSIIISKPSISGNYNIIEIINYQLISYYFSTFYEKWSKRYVRMLEGQHVFQFISFFYAYYKNYVISTLLSMLT